MSNIKYNELGDRMSYAEGMLLLARNQSIN